MVRVPLRCICLCDCYYSQNYCHIEFYLFLLHNGVIQFYISSYFFDGLKVCVNLLTIMLKAQ